MKWRTKGRSTPKPLRESVRRAREQVAAYGRCFAWCADCGLPLDPDNRDDGAVRFFECCYSAATQYAEIIDGDGVEITRGRGARNDT